MIDWLSKAKGVGVGDLIARRKHAKAIEVLRAEIEAGSRSSQMRNAAAPSGRRRPGTGPRHPR